MGLISTEGEGAAETELAEENQVRLIAFFRSFPFACLLAADHDHYFELIGMPMKGTAKLSDAYLWMDAMIGWK